MNVFSCSDCVRVWWFKCVEKNVVKKWQLWKFTVYVEQKCRRTVLKKVICKSANKKPSWCVWVFWKKIRNKVCVKLPETVLKLRAEQQCTNWTVTIGCRIIKRIWRATEQLPLGGVSCYKNTNDKKGIKKKTGKAAFCIFNGKVSVISFLNMQKIVSV